MKTLTLIILTLMCGFTSQTQAQQLRLSNTENLDFFVGTWKYENEQTGETFLLRLRKTRDTIADIAKECVVGAYTYRPLDRRGVNCMDQFFSTSKKPISMPVYATNSSRDKNNVNPNKLRMYVTDYGLYAPNGDAKWTPHNELLVVSRDTPNQIRWILNDESNIEIPKEETPPPGFSIPTDIILRKVADE